MVPVVSLLLASLASLALGDAAGPAETARYQVDYKAYEDYKKEVEAAGHGAMNYTAFTKAYDKYQQFMEYLHKEGSHSPVNFHKFLADYQQYMGFKSYLGKGVHQQEGHSDNFKDFLNFEKYLQYTRSSGQGDYKQFFPPAGVQLDAAGDDSGEADSSKDSAGAGDAGGFSQYQQGYVPAGTTEGGPKGGLPAVTADFHQYMDYSKYMGISHKYTKKDWMSQWQKFQQEGQKGQDQQAPRSPADCKTEAELDAWRDKQKQIAKEWIPDMYQEPTLSSIDKEYKDNLDRIKHPKAEPKAKGKAEAPAEDASVADTEPLVLAKEDAPRPQLSVGGARAATSPVELVAWRAQMGATVEQLPKEEQDQWNTVLDGEMKAAFKRLEADQGEVQLAEKAPPARRASTGLSRTLLAFVVSFSLPVAGMYIYRAVKKAPGTDLDERFLAVGEA